MATAVCIDDIAYNTHIPAPDENRGFAGSCFRNRWGPFTVGSSMYVILERRGYYGMTNPILCFKSTDNGTTWSVVDYAGRFRYNGSGQSDVPLGGDFMFSYVDQNTGKLYFKPFDQATDLWEAAITDGPLVDWETEGLHLHARSDGSLVFIYDKEFYPEDRLVYSVYSSGAWTEVDQTIDISPHALPFAGAGGGIQVITSVVDPSDTIHIFYGYVEQWLETPHPELYYIPLTTSGLGSRSTIWNNTLLDCRVMLRVGVASVWGDVLAVPIYENVAGSETIAILEGTPLAAPVWDKKYIPLGGYTPGFSIPLVTPEGWDFPGCTIRTEVLFGALRLFWLSLPHSHGGPDLDNEILMSIRGASDWGNPILIYESINTVNRTFAIGDIGGCEVAPNGDIGVIFMQDRLPA